MCVCVILYMCVILNVILFIKLCVDHWFHINIYMCVCVDHFRSMDSPYPARMAHMPSPRCMHRLMIDKEAPNN